MIGHFQKMMIDLAPEWLREKNAASFLGAAGLILDLSQQRLIEGIRAGQPLRCDVSALREISAQRRLRIYASEPIASQRFRLSRWHQLHRQRGTHQGEMRNLQPYFLGADGLGVLPNIWIVHQDGRASPTCTWHNLSPAGVYSVTRVTSSNFNFDNNGVDSAVPVAPPWQGAHVYIAGDAVSNDGQKTYVATVGGTSAASGGPTGTGSNIVDGVGALRWRFARPWSRWWGFIDISTVNIQTLTHYDDGSVYDGGQVYDGVSAQVGADLVSMLVDWKGSPSRCNGVALTTVPINPTATPVQHADGWWTLPNGKWGRYIDPVTHKATRPPYMTWLLDRSQV